MVVSTVPDQRGGGAWQKRRGGVFEGGWYPSAHYAFRIDFILG